MMLEGRFEDSIDRFEEGWRIYSINSDPNSEYLTAYCRCFISFYAGDGLQIDLIRYASSLNADPVIKTLFKLPKENPLPEFF